MNLVFMTTLLCTLLVGVRSIGALPSDTHGDIINRYMGQEVIDNDPDEGIVYDHYLAYDDEDLDDDEEEYEVFFSR